MTDKNKELMLKLIEEKRQKSSSQRNDKRGMESGVGGKRSGIKQYKKGGLFDK